MKALIVSADHSWRESNLFDQRRDLRVPFVVRAPGQTNGVLYAPQFNTILTHDLVLGILRGEVSDASKVPDWLEAHRSTQSTVADPRSD